MKNSIYRLTSVVGAFSLLCGQMFASSHSDAPLSKQDPQTNLTDVYAFVTPATRSPSWSTAGPFPNQATASCTIGLPMTRSTASTSRTR
jgi:hypothetical protein